MANFEHHRPDMKVSEKQPYEAAVLVELGTIAEMTRLDPGVDDDGVVFFALATS